MSTESAKAFWERVKTDEAFARRVAACKDAQARGELVKAEGYEFTNEELKNMYELDAEALDKIVAGLMSRGGCVPWIEYVIFPVPPSR